MSRLGLLIFSLALLFAHTNASAWDNHDDVTRFALQAYDGWELATFEPIESVLPSLSVNGAAAPATLEDLGKQLNIRREFVDWKWRPESDQATMLEVIVRGVVEADNGMDQELNISPDQKYMGGYTGLSSQGIRHMFYRNFDLSAPVATFHIPLHQMGYAPERAELFFELASQAKRAGHVFWGYRFLGLGLHYVQDIGQPYHATQFASLRLLAFKKLFSQGWDAFVAETTRLVSNFHLSFEGYAKYLLGTFTSTLENSKLTMAFRVPKVNEKFKAKLEYQTDLSIKEGVIRLAEESSNLAGSIVAAQTDVMGATLFDAGTDLSKGYQVNFAVVDSNSQTARDRDKLRELIFRAYSNTGVATRWYVDRFRSIKLNL